MPREYLYEKISNKDYWKKYLERDLTLEECVMLRETKLEKIENRKLEIIHNLALQNGLYINKLTSMNGNCLFESFKHIGLCTDGDDMRQGMAFLMAIVENVNLQEEFKCYDVLHTTPKEAFEFTNDISYVHCIRKNRLYKYTYQTMCRDMYGDRSWDRLATEIILRVMSIVFNYRFRIFHSTGYISEINPKSEYEPETINLGLMGEFHYVPIVPLPKDTTELPPCPKFRDGAKMFHRWAKTMALSLGKYIDNSDEEDQETNRDETLQSINSSQAEYEPMEIDAMDQKDFISM